LNFIHQRGVGRVAETKKDKILGCIPDLSNRQLLPTTVSIGHNRDLWSQTGKSYAVAGLLTQDFIFCIYIISRDIVRE
jgi:hypothetical protein